MQIHWENIPAFSVKSHGRSQGNLLHFHTIFTLNLYTVLFLFFPYFHCRVQRKRKGKAHFCTQFEQSTTPDGEDEDQRHHFNPPGFSPQ